MLFFHSSTVLLWLLFFLRVMSTPTSMRPLRVPYINPPAPTNEYNREKAQLIDAHNRAYKSSLQAYNANAMSAMSRMMPDPVGPVLADEYQHGLQSELLSRMRARSLPFGWQDLLHDVLRHPHLYPPDSHSQLQLAERHLGQLLLDMNDLHRRLRQERIQTPTEAEAIRTHSRAPPMKAARFEEVTLDLAPPTMTRSEQPHLPHYDLDAPVPSSAGLYARAQHLYPRK